jgi:hypothetical protein
MFEVLKQKEVGIGAGGRVAERTGRDFVAAAEIFELEMFGFGLFAEDSSAFEEQNFVFAVADSDLVAETSL